MIVFVVMFATVLLANTGDCLQYSQYYTSPQPVYSNHYSPVHQHAHHQQAQASHQQQLYYVPVQSQQHQQQHHHQPQQQFAQMSYVPSFTRNYWTPSRSANFVNRNFAYVPASTNLAPAATTFELTPVHRTYVTPQTVYPQAVHSRYIGNRMLTVPTLSVLPPKKKKKTTKKTSSKRPERIIVPVGSSVYRKVQYVDSIEQDPAVTSIFDSWKKKFFSSTSPVEEVIKSKGQAKNSVIIVDSPKKANDKKLKNEFDTDWSHRAVSVAPITLTELPKNGSVRVAEGSEISEVKVTENGDDTSASDDTDSEYTPRYIELQPSTAQVPLTIQFPSRTSKLNILSGEEMFGGSSDKTTKTNDLVGQSSSNGGHVMIGPERKDEPLVLKDRKTEIPDRMQSIIKCVFPDFRFDGDDQVKSAC